jgi:type II secretory ATPase GspE/PulE/Tfp pilus assembly ATPase PilB-like protein
MGKGCDHCHGLGFVGREPVSELLVVDETIEQVILNRSSVRELELVARRNGMRTLWENGLDKVRSGTLSPDELVRIVPKAISDVKAPTV